MTSRSLQNLGVRENEVGFFIGDSITVKLGGKIIRENKGNGKLRTERKLGEKKKGERRRELEDLFIVFQKRQK